MINQKQAQRYCCEDISKIYGYKEAVADKEKTWDIHHCLGLVWSREELIEMGLYYNQPADRLMFVTKTDHKKLHNKLDYNNETAYKKISKAHKGKPKSEEHKRNISKAHKGKPKSEKSKIKNRESHECKRVLQLTKDGILIKEWASINLAADTLQISAGNISKCCNKTGNCKSYKGFLWRFPKTNYTNS